MKNFTIELTYQPINNQWSALIKHGSLSYLDVDEDMMTAIEKVTTTFFEVYPPLCQRCGGTGEVSKMEQVYPGEPHMADIGTETCPDCNGKGHA